MSNANKDYRYPKCEKLQKVAKNSQIIGEYLDWSFSNADLVHGKTIEERLALYFDIDLNKVEAERRLIIERMNEE